MHIPHVEIHDAGSVAQVSDLMVQYAPDVRVLAGGTDLLVDLKTGRASTGHLISVNRIDAMRGISMNGDELRIGARTTVTELGRSPHVRDSFSALLDATSRMANPQIRNVATVGGNLASAVPCADLPPILMVMDASATIFSPNGERNVPLISFFKGPRQTALSAGDVLTSINVPRPADRFGAAYARFALRNGNAIAVAGVAAGLSLKDDSTVSSARVVLGAVAPIPKVVEAAADCLIDRTVDEGGCNEAADAAMAAAEPITDVRGSAEYRREIVGVLTRRAIATAHRRAKETHR